jgi:tripartite-type tricarboxylate transporter receptor subunit TctC
MKNILVTVLTLLVVSVSQAQDAESFPKKSIRMIVPLASGGGSDIVGRIVSSGLSEHWNQHVIVDNRPGAGGSIGNLIVSRALSDGYTLLFTSSTLAISASMIKNDNFDVERDLSPISLIASQPSVILINNQLTMRNLSDLVTQMRSNPGKFNFGSAGVGTASHLANELFLVESKTTAMHIPYKSAGVAATGLAKNELHFMVTNLATASALMQNKRAHALAITSKNRHQNFPDLPTADEAGLKNFEYTTWYGMLAPAKTSKNIIDKINNDIINVVNNTTIKPRLEQQGLNVVASTVIDFKKQLKFEIKKWNEVIKSANIKTN